MCDRSEESHLSKLTCKILSGMKVGIVCSSESLAESTQSSIVQALFRLSECQSNEPGKVLIDGVETRDLGLHLLRKSIGYVPRSPNMIGGTIRANLDPVGEYSEDQLDKALQQVHLDATFCEDGLQTVITDAFTTGHKRLLCLAHAILHKARITVLEESTELTANCESEQIIDQKLKSNSSDLTVVILT